MHARPFEFIQIRHIQPPISSPAGDHDRAGAGAFIVGQFENKAIFVGGGLEADHLVRNRHFSPELLRLAVGARHQAPCR